MKQDIIIQMLFGSSVIAAFITAIFTFIKNDKQSRLEHITVERKNWRESMRSIMEEIQDASYQETLNCMAKLKVRINAYGSNYSDSYMDDAHIWKLIKKIEKMDCNNINELHKYQNQMIEYVSLLLKYDWERSKKEVKGNKLNAISFGFFMFSIVYFIFTISINMEEVTTKNVVWMIVSLIIVFLTMILAYNNLPIYLISNEFKFKKGKKKYIIYYLKCVAVFFISLVAFVLLINICYKQIINHGTQNIFIYCYVCAFAYALGESFQFISSNGKIEEINKYGNAIELINNGETDKKQKGNENLNENKVSADN